jgi:hypothetical protein
MEEKRLSYYYKNESHCCLCNTNDFSRLKSIAIADLKERGIYEDDWDEPHDFMVTEGGYVIFTK